jgi:RNA polymerase sigma-70 factor, ECF subfamily
MILQVGKPYLTTITRTSPEYSRYPHVVRTFAPPMNDFREELVQLLPRLRRFAYGLSGQRDDADDLVQAACERALERSDQWEPGTRLDSWMYRIIQNLWFDRLRSRKVRGDPVDMEDIEPQADEHAHRAPELRSDLARVSDALQQLRPEHRELLMLVCVEELSYKEAAELLQIPMGTVMSRLARARLALHELLAAGAANPAKG